MNNNTSSSGAGLFVVVLIAIVAIALVAFVALRLVDGSQDGGDEGLNLPIPTLVPSTDSSTGGLPAPAGSSAAQIVVSGYAPGV
jgi:hypothetical protein